MSVRVCPEKKDHPMHKDTAELVRDSVEWFWYLFNALL